jgi:hypothetical protein
MGIYTPQYANPNDGELINICKILEILSLGAQNVTAGGNAFDVNLVPSIGNGFPFCKSITSGTSAGQTNLVQLKTSAGVLGTLIMCNTNNGSDYFVNIYDDANVTSGNIASKTPLMCSRIMKGDLSLNVNIAPGGLNLNNGLAVAIVTSFNGSTLVGSTTGVDVTAIYL